MLKNQLKIAVRSLTHQRAYSLINVLGLSLGMACCLVILLHIADELSYDNFHDKSDRIYRVLRNWQTVDSESNLAANSPAAVGPTLASEFAAVEAFTRVMFPYPQSVLISSGEARFYEERFYWADSTIFQIFSFRLERGDPSTALTGVNSIVLTERMARKYFGDVDPLGKILTVEGWTRDDYQVTGVLADVPHNSHLQFDFLASVAGANRRYTYLYSGEGQWTNSLGYNYILLRDGASASDLEAQLADFGERHLGDFARSRGFKPDFKLQPLAKIHLQSGISTEPTPTNDVTYIYLFAAVAGIILLIACINYMNLATARSSRRAREVGMRKVLGAPRRSLVYQFIAESMTVSLGAFLLALVLVEFLLPIFNSLSGKTLALRYFHHVDLLTVYFGISLTVGLLAGSYPAFVLSAFQPISTLKGQLRSGYTNLITRKGLISLQFVASIALIIATAVIWRQLDFVRNRALGFSKEQVVILPIRDRSMRESTEIARQEMLRHPNIVNVSAAAGVPGRTMLVDGFPVRPEGADRTQQIPMQIVGLDYDYFEALDVKLLAGRSFRREIASDSAAGFVINEAAAEAFGWADPLGRRIELVMNNGKRGTIIGVVGDFHFRSLHDKIQPMVFHVWPERYSCFVVKVNTVEIPETLQALEAIWRDLVPSQPFEFFFLDSEFDGRYQQDERIGQVFGYAAALAVFVACLGLFGLASLIAEQRTKEIGIRKVLGASVSNISLLLSREFGWLVLAANVVAWPIGYTAMTRWLERFAYRVQLEWWVFVGAGGLTLLIALLTVSTQATRAALANPVDSLRHE